MACGSRKNTKCKKGSKPVKICSNSCRIVSGRKVCKRCRSCRISCRKSVKKLTKKEKCKNGSKLVRVCSRSHRRGRCSGGTKLVCRTLSWLENKRAN
jgi:hypothetical protein